MSAACAEVLVREEEKIICTVDTVEFCQLPTEAYNLLKQSGLNTPEAAPCRSRNLRTEASCGDALSSTTKLEKIMAGTAVKKGSQLKKSIQSSIGRLIHGTERRYALGYMIRLSALILSYFSTLKKYFILVTEILYSIYQFSAVTITLYIYHIATIIYYIIFFPHFSIYTGMLPHSAFGLPLPWFSVGERELCI